MNDRQTQTDRKTDRVTERHIDSYRMTDGTDLVIDETDLADPIDQLRNWGTEMEFILNLRIYGCTECSWCLSRYPVAAP